ncbi:hypothetical protein [Spirosoma endophyticum]|uniref:Uncharacterized protein n=1 Tax=Spirosoma endophyticum TaxID=662367 RepID=A0A1I1VMN2_9BACT|nr:hypothetical protein [Spirosoma endophyticum]SFD81830.1 hypothetical protein SAMN05216167_107166 [Spirosoma endophyticum]
MTPDKRLDQIELVLADVAQKTDRLIESNGQILEVALRTNANAELAAKGVTDLTIKVNQLAEGQVNLGSKTDLLAEGQADLRNITVDLRNKTNLLTQGQADLQTRPIRLPKDRPAYIEKQTLLLMIRLSYDRKCSKAFRK